jgi:hypothetical protein
MSDTIGTLRALHTQACAAVSKVDRSLTPAEEAFWPLYLCAVLELQRAHASDSPCTTHDIRHVGGVDA